LHKQNLEKVKDRKEIERVWDKEKEVWKKRVGKIERC
jgi:hypothetical protein